MLCLVLDATTAAKDTDAYAVGYVVENCGEKLKDILCHAYTPIDGLLPVSPNKKQLFQGSQWLPRLLVRIL